MSRSTPCWVCRRLSRAQQNPRLHDENPDRRAATFTLGGGGRVQYCASPRSNGRTPQYLVLGHGITIVDAIVDRPLFNALANPVAARAANPTGAVLAHRGYPVETNSITVPR
jgi:hypothetical protein